LFDANPIAGRWHLGRRRAEPGQRAEIEQPFQARSASRPADAGDGLPRSANKVLKAGQPVQATVLIRNTGVQPLAIGADPRLDKVQTLQPVPIQAA